MALYRRTINTLSGPGQSIPDHGAQEALQAKALQIEMMKAIISQQNAMENASFKRRKFALERKDRKESIKRAGELSKEEKVFREEEREFRREQKRWRQQDKEFQQQLKLENAKATSALKGKEEEEHITIPTPPEIKQLMPGLPDSVTIKQLNEIGRSVGMLAKGSGVKSQIKAEVRKVIANFMSTKQSEIYKNPGAELNLEDDLFMDLEIAYGDLKSKYGDSVDLDSIFKEEVEERLSRSRGLSRVEKRVQQAEPGLSDMFSSGGPPLSEFLPWQDWSPESLKWAQDQEREKLDSTFNQLREALMQAIRPSPEGK